MWDFDSPVIVIITYTHSHQELHFYPQEALVCIEIGLKKRLRVCLYDIKMYQLISGKNKDTVNSSAN